MCDLRFTIYGQLASLCASSFYSSSRELLSEERGKFEGFLASLAALYRDAATQIAP